MGQYSASVYKPNPNTLVIAAGGTLKAEAGATITGFGASVTPAPAVTSLTNSTTGTVSDVLAALAAVTALTDNSTGTSGGNVIAAVTDPATAANAIATLATKVNALLAEYADIRNAIASLAAKQNATLAAMRTAGVLTP